MQYPVIQYKFNFISHLFTNFSKLMFNTHRYYLIQPEPKADTGDKKSAATADEDSKVLVNMISTEVCKMWFFEKLDQLQFSLF